MYHDATPIPIKRNENSLICPRDIHVRKLFFLVCPRNHSVIIITIGLIINTNTMNINSGREMLVIFQKLTCDQSSTKNIMIKKSLSGFILLVISNLYDEFARVIHATKVPISTPNHN